MIKTYLAVVEFVSQGVLSDCFAFYDAKVDGIGCGSLEVEMVNGKGDDLANGSENGVERRDCVKMELAICRDCEGRRNVVTR